MSIKFTILVTATNLTPKHLMTKGCGLGGRQRLPRSPVTAGPESLAPIRLVPDRLPPPTVREIPGDRLAKPGAKGLGRFPTQLAADLGAIHGVAPVVTRAISNEDDQVLMRPMRRIRKHL